MCLEEGQHVAEQVNIRHPLHIIGHAGAVLTCNSCTSALHVHANTMLEGFRIQATKAACVTHHAGRLHLHTCHLICDTRRLDHLYFALITHAAARANATTANAAKHPSGAVLPSSGAAARHRTDGRAELCAHAALHMRAHNGATAAAAAAAQGVALEVRPPTACLHVEETTISGSLRAVCCLGNAFPEDVRMVVYGTRAHFWFSVAGLPQRLLGAVPCTPPRVAQGAARGGRCALTSAHLRGSGAGPSDVDTSVSPADVEQLWLKSLQHKKRRRLLDSL